MVVQHNVKGYDEFTKVVEELEGSGQPIHVLFSGGKNENGESWCPYCVKAEPIIHDALSKAPEKSHFVHVDVGERVYWKDLNCPFRKDPNTHLVFLPTLLRWKSPQRLDGDRCSNKELVEMMFEDGNLRKLIKYEERIGINTQQNDYYESLFRRTTASYRAKIDQENDKGGPAKKRSSDIEPSCSRYATTENRKALSERNYGEASPSSNNVLDKRSYSSESKTQKNVEEKKSDERSLKAHVEKTLTQILQNKYSQEFIDKDHNNISKEKSPINSIVEQVLEEKLADLRYASRERLSVSKPGSFRSIIEDIITQILNEKLSGIQKESAKSVDRYDGVKSLNQDPQQSLKVSKEQTSTLPREPVTHYNTKKSIDSQSLVQQLLSFEGADTKNGKTKNPKAGKENLTTVPTTGRIKRLQQSPKKNPEWQAPSLHDKIVDKPVKAIRSQSPVSASSARSGRSKSGSSVLIRRSKSQGRYRKPNSDPVALYQYYKNEWEHFRNQIPGETSHNRLRWHVRQRLLDPE